MKEREWENCFANDLGVLRGNWSLFYDCNLALFQGRRGGRMKGEVEKVQ
jgi:hypothetical protein